MSRPAAARQMRSGYPLRQVHALCKPVARVAQHRKRPAGIRPRQKRWPRGGKWLIECHRAGQARKERPPCLDTLCRRVFRSSAPVSRLLLLFLRPQVAVPPGLFLQRNQKRHLQHWLRDGPTVILTAPVRRVPSGKANPAPMPVQSRAIPVRSLLARCALAWPVAIASAASSALLLAGTCCLKCCSEKPLLL